MNKLNLLAWFILLPLSTSLSGQTIYDHVDNDWPNSRYIVHGDGTLTDTGTSLMWRQCVGDGVYDAAIKTCSGGLSSVSWHGAIDITNSYSDGTYSDWRLPNIKELESIMAYNRSAPTVNSDIFIDIDSFYNISGISKYWSSTPRSHTSSGDFYSLVAQFSDGTIGLAIRDNADISYIMVRDAE